MKKYISENKGKLSSAIKVTLTSIKVRVFFLSPEVPGFWPAIGFVALVVTASGSAMLLLLVESVVSTTEHAHTSVSIQYHDFLNNGYCTTTGISVTFNNSESTQKGVE